MPNREIRLRELLAYYGSDIANWPETARTWGLKALEQPELAALVREEQRFEQLLLKRRVPAASPTFAERIIAASQIRSQAPGFAGWIPELLAIVRPSALAAMLVLGFTIGFGMLTSSPHGRDTTFVQSTSDDEGAIL